MNNRLEIPEKLICTVLFLLAFFADHQITAAAGMIIMLLYNNEKVQKTAAYILIIALTVLCAKYLFYLPYRAFRYISGVFAVNETFISTLYRISVWVSDVLLILGRILAAVLAFLSFSGKDYSISFIDALFAKQKQDAGTAAPVRQIPVQPVPTRMFCEHCGKPVLPGDNFCLSCGKPVKTGSD